MSPCYKAHTLAERYDLSRNYMWEENMPPNAPRPLPTSYWPKENIEFLERYRDWLLSGGTSEMTTNNFHIMMAGHVFGLTLKPNHELDPEVDLECALEYVKAKQLSPTWTTNCKNSLLKFRRFLRLERGLGEESKITPFDSARVTGGLPLWLVNELQRYQRRHAEELASSQDGSEHLQILVHLSRACGAFSWRSTRFNSWQI